MVDRGMGRVGGSGSGDGDGGKEWDLLGIQGREAKDIDYSNYGNLSH